MSLPAKAPESEHSLPHRVARFSIPAYLCAMLAGSETVAVLVAAGVIVSGGTGAFLVLVVVLVVAPLAALVALPLFLPSALMTLLVVNRWQFDHPAIYGGLNAAFGAITAGLLGLLSNSLATGMLWLVAGVVGGFVAGVVYRWVNLHETRNILT